MFEVSTDRIFVVVAASFCAHTEYEEPSFVKDLCKSNPNMAEFMTAADIMIRSDCFLVDSCRRVVDRPHADGEEVDFIVVGGGVAGKTTEFEK